MKHVCVLLLVGLLISTGSIAQIFTQGNGVTDVDGNFYPSIILGTQEWMQENLTVGHYNNGDLVQVIEDSVEWLGLWSTTIGARCWFENDSVANEVVFGKLYNWNAVNDVKGLCPTGWHYPKDDEWKTLEIFLGMDSVVANQFDFRGIEEGGMLKSLGVGIWNPPNAGASNLSGFTALPSGVRGWDAEWEMPKSAVFWASLANDPAIPENVWTRELWTDSSKVRRYVRPWWEGASCRCVKNSPNSINELQGQDSNIEIFPNPSTGVFILKQRGSFEVYNTLGERLLEGYSNGNHQFDLKGWSEGIYILRLRTKEGTASTRLILQR